MPTLSGPTNFASTANAVGGIVLTWSGVVGNTGYTLLRSTVSGDYSASVSATVSSNIVTYTASSGLTLGTPYYFVAQTSNASGLGAYSIQRTATPRTVPSTMLAPTLSAGVTNISVGYVAPNSNGAPIITYSIQRSTVSAMTTALSTVTTLLNPYPSISLVAGTTYYYRVAASNAAGLGTYSAVSSNTPYAIAPNIVVFSSTTPGNQQISLAWTAPSSNGAAITSYELNYSTDTSSTGFTTLSSGLLVSPFVSTGLNNGTTYYYQMRASNSVGAGLYSTTVSNIPRTIPGKVGTVTVTPLAASVSLAWPTTTVSNGDPITSYYYYWSLSGSGTFTGVSNASSAFTAVKTLLTNGSAYLFYVAASNAAGFGLSSDVVGATPRTIPSAPTISVTGIDSSNFNISFSTPASGGANITSYLLTPLRNAVAQSPVTVYSSPVTYNGSFGVSYTFRVQASNVVGAGTSSTTVAPATPNYISGGAALPDPAGNTYWFYPATAVATAAVAYNLPYADVSITQLGRGSWSILYNGLSDTLNFVRNISLADRKVWIMDISYGAGLGNNYVSISNNLSNGDVLKVGSGVYLAATEPTIRRSITLEGQPDGSSVFGVAPGVSTYCLKIEGNDIIVRNLTLTTCYAQTTYTRGDYLLLAGGTNTTISGTANVIPSLSNVLLENMTFVNPYTLNSTASELQYWRNRRGVAFNSVSGLVISNCTFPKTWNFDMTLASCRNVELTSNTFYACPWSTIAVTTTAQIMMKAFLSNDYSEYESSNINIANNTYNVFGDPSITSIIADPSYGAGSNAATYITPLQNPVLTFQPSTGYTITYSSNAGSTVQIPADFRYSFVSSPLLAYVAREPLDLPASFWAGTAQSVVVTDLSENVQINPPGYCPLSNRNIYRPTLVLTPSLTKGDVTITVNPLIEYATYTFSIDASEVQTSNVSGSYTFLGATLSDGQHIVTVTGTDGVVTSDTSVVYFTFDSTPPAINLISASIPDLSGQVIVNFDVSDGAGIVACTTYVNDVSYVDGLVFPLTVNLSYQAYGGLARKFGVFVADIVDLRSTCDSRHEYRTGSRGSRPVLWRKQLCGAHHFKRRGNGGVWRIGKRGDFDH